MASELRLTFLGGFAATVDGEPVAGLTSHKAQALLCYLAVTGRAHSRPALAGLLWPDIPEANARMNLRKDLARLTEVLSPYVHSSRQGVALAAEANCRIDVAEFETLLDAPPSIETLAAAVALYQGDFLEGFYVLNTPAFDEWALRQRGRLRERVLLALETLADAHSQQGQPRRAIAAMQQLLALEPWHEEAHCQIMRLYAQNGQRAQALAQYETCRRILHSELDVEPAAETTALAAAIEQGAFAVSSPPQAAAPLPLAPPFLALAHRRQLASAPFVARERQLGVLQGFLDQALAGEGQILFVTGEAGSGKTALIQEFIRRSLAQHADLAPVYGHCTAYHHVGDPLLPFREIVGWLTGDIESHWLTGAMTRDHALRLWRLLPAAVALLLNASVELLDTLVPAAPLIRRVGAYLPGDPDLLAGLQQWQARAQGPDRGRHIEQSQIFAACTELFTGLAAQCPLLLVLEDLHWSDLSSISLLFHLARRLRSAGAGARILVVGSYRPEALATGPEAIPHPLAGVIQEFKRDYGDIWLDLDQAGEDESRRLLDTLIDLEPNRLDERFRQTLLGQTRGHALFTVELLRALRERGDLVQDERGQWIEGDRLDWQTLPAQVEGVIEKRIGSLPPALRDLLAVASVEGEEFTAQVLAQILERRERVVLQQLAQTLDKEHHLVRASSEGQVGRQWLTRYRFGHALIQQYVYGSLSAGERRLLHGEIGAALAALYGDHSDEIAVQLAHHFVQAAAWEQALPYLRLAGDKARTSYANQEAIAFYSQALAIGEQMQPPPAPAELLPIYEGRALVHLLLADYANAVADFKEMAGCARAAGHLQKEGEGLCQLAYIYWLTFSAANTPLVADYAGQAQRLALQTGDQHILAQSLIQLGAVDQVHGQMAEADEKFAQALAISRRGEHKGALGHALVFSCMQSYLQGEYAAAIGFGVEGVQICAELNDAFTELRALAFLCQSYWGAGEYSQALALLQRGLHLSRERENTFIAGRLLNTQGWFHRELGDAAGAAELDRESIDLGRAAGISNVEISALVNLGLDHIALGAYGTALACLQPTLARVEKEGFGAHRWRWTMKLLLGLAEVHYATAAYTQALPLAEAALKQASATRSQKYVAQGLGLRGRILWAGGEAKAGGRDLQAAVALAGSLHSPALLYPLAYELGRWYAGAGEEGQAASCYEQAAAAAAQISKALDGMPLAAKFEQSAQVDAIRQAVRGSE